MKDFYKVVLPGYGDYGRVFIEIEFKDGRLSITGVEGPKANGDARGSCGQCRDFDVSGCLAEGWTAEMVSDLRSIWDEWHLNDMKAGCEHQRAAGWGSKELTVVTYQLRTDVLMRQQAVEKKAQAALKEGRSTQYTEEELALVNLDWQIKADEAHAGVLGDDYKVERKETKLSGWVYEREHPEGVLAKACPECGWRYGSGWLKVDVPADILWWLRNLPDSPHSLPGAWARR